MKTLESKTDAMHSAPTTPSMVDTNKECERLIVEALMDRPERRELPDGAREVAQAIDHTYLNITEPINDTEEVIRVCREAQEYAFASVCIRPEHVRVVQTLFSAWTAEDIRICTVIGFPQESGYDPTTWHNKSATPNMMKEETLKAIQNGADEFDMVINTQMVLEGDTEGATEGIRSVVEAVHKANKDDLGHRTVKVIVESPYLREKGGTEALHRACQTVIAGEADYIKTSTGFKPAGIPTGATAEDVMLMVNECKNTHGILVKASGGIGTAQAANAMLALGADRLGMSKGVKVIEDLRKNPSV